MAPPPTKSPVTGNAVPDHYIHSDTAYFRDVHGRSLLLRGINFSGSAKAPVGQPSQKLEGFWEAGESGDLTFVGRPLDLNDGSADVGECYVIGEEEILSFNPFRCTWVAYGLGDSTV